MSGDTMGGPLPSGTGLDAADAADAADAMATTTAKPLTLEELQVKLDHLHKNTDAFFLLVIGMLIFFMQGGFAFLEAGSVRTKNTVNILIKNMLDALIGGVSYWAIGWACAYGPGGNGFIGGSHFFSVGMGYENYPNWFFQFVFAATAATIISGAIAERCQFSAYFVYSIVITGWVYPPVSHWAWDGSTPGFLNQWGFHDFAGSSVVHLMGATCSIVACYFIKPRLGRFNEDGTVNDMPGHSVPLAATGGFILLFGFLAFNGGSQASIASDGDADTVARAVVNTIMGGCGGGLCVLIANKYLTSSGQWSYSMTLNGTLTGMVAQCAGCNVFQPWASVLIGVIGGFGFLGGHFLLFKLKIDDPLDAVPVHGCGGLIGIVSMPFFAFETGILWQPDSAAAWEQLGVNLLGTLIIVAWSFSWSVAMFGPLAYFKLLRIDRETEFRGNDLIKHGESAYPAESWVELQYNSDGAKALPGNMAGTGEGTKGKNYNDAMEMVPTTGKMFKQMSSFAMMGPSGAPPAPEKEAEEGNAK